MHVDTHVKAAKYLTYLLEDRFKIFGLRFGLDPILGLAPWIGDIISAFLALYIVWIGVQVRVPSDKLAVMLRNIVFDFLIGLIPVVGDVSDFVFRSNSKNLDIILKYHKGYTEGEIMDSTLQTA